MTYCLSPSDRACIFLVLGVLDLADTVSQLRSKQSQRYDANQGQDWTGVEHSGPAVGPAESVPVALGLCLTNVAGGIAAGAAGAREGDGGQGERRERERRGSICAHLHVS
jgi:hypothetical protein